MVWQGGSQVEVIITPTQDWEPSTTEGALSVRGADLKDRIVVKLQAWNLLNRLPRLREGLLEDVNAALQAISTMTVTETNHLSSSSHHGDACLEMKSHREQYLWRGRL